MARYHMIDYIHEGADALRRTLNDNEPAVQSIAKQVADWSIKRVIVAGIGSSYTAAVMAGPLFSYHCALPSHIMAATELVHVADRLVNKEALVVIISRSGERKWVIDPLKEAVEREALGVAMTGSADSLLAQSGNVTLLTAEGPEITFPKTKSVIACAGLLMRLALALAPANDDLSQRRLEALYATPESIRRAVEEAEPQIQRLMPFVQGHRFAYMAGSASNYGAALESAVKLQETAYIPSRAEDTGNAFHGPLGVFSEEWLAVPLITPADLELSKEFLKLTRVFGGHSLSIRSPGLELAGMSDREVVLPDTPDPLLAGLVYLPPAQLLTYYWALANGRNPDEPEAMHAMLAAFLPPGRQEPELREKEEDR